MIWEHQPANMKKIFGTPQPMHFFFACKFLLMWSFCCCSVTKSCLTLCDTMDCSTSGFSVLHYLTEFAQTHVPLSQWCHPTISSSVTPFSFCFPSIRVFSNESILHIRWPKYESFSFNISPSNEYSGLISFRIDWFDCFTVQGTLRRLLQHHSSKVSFLQCSAFLKVQLSHHTWLLENIIALTRWTFIGKVMSLLLNILSRFVIAILPRGKCLLVLWLQSPSTLILET